MPQETIRGFCPGRLQDRTGRPHGNSNLFCRRRDGWTTLVPLIRKPTMDKWGGAGGVGGGEEEWLLLQTTRRQSLIGINVENKISWSFY